MGRPGVPTLFPPASVFRSVPRFVPSCAAIASLFAVAGAADPQAHQANGVKIGEVTPTSAIIWTRLTKNAEWNTTGPKPGGKTPEEVPADADIPGLLHAA